MWGAFIEVRDMLFVTVGSQKFPFDRLIKKVDQMLREGLIQEEVFIQTGASRCVPSCPHQAFCEGGSSRRCWRRAAC